MVTLTVEGKNSGKQTLVINSITYICQQLNFPPFVLY